MRGTRLWVLTRPHRQRFMVPTSYPAPKRKKSSRLQVIRARVSLFLECTMLAHPPEAGHPPGEDFVIGRLAGDWAGILCQIMA